MSAQMAIMAGTMALSAYSSIAAGSAQAQGMEGSAMQARVGGAQSDLQASESKIMAQNEELQRRKGLMKLLASNRADNAMRGVSGEQGSSFDVIQDYNESEAARDIANIRYMGESRVRKLSFAKDQQDIMATNYLNMAGMARTQGVLGAVRSLGMAAYSMYGGFGGGGSPSPGAGAQSGGWNYAGAGTNNGVMNGP